MSEQSASKADADEVIDVQNELSLLLYGRPVDSQNVGELEVSALYRIRALETKLPAANKRIAELERENVRLRKMVADLQGPFPSATNTLLKPQVNTAPQDCTCLACIPHTVPPIRMALCSVCGNKRCPHATDHRNACTGSNESGQAGSIYE